MGTSLRTLVALACALSAFVVSSAAADTTRWSTPRGSAHGPLTDREFSIAKAIARHEEAKFARTVVSATATLRAGTVTDSNTGHRCTSGQLVTIKVIGTFDIGVSGPPSTVRSKPSDYAVHAMLITTDPKSGRPCLIGVQTGNVTPEPGSVLLYRR